MTQNPYEKKGEENSRIQRYAVETRGYFLQLNAAAEKIPAGKPSNGEQIDCTTWPTTFNASG
ncbi:MAG: hypothetical protein ACUVSA_03235 [Desulfosoma sp.]|uniref:hypothetical protein n=1 Tax=Desulfosoma sp. TaxID=2603217 RepID=UPI0040490125